MGTLMGDFNAISSLVIYLTLTGYLMILIGGKVSASRQHEFAFAAILLLILGTLPQLSLPQVAPGILISLGMMLIALHFSAYYSGTPKNSARLYAVLLFMNALMLAQLAHPMFQEFGFTRLFLMGGVWYFLLKFEKIISGSNYVSSRSERIFLGTWISSAGLDLAGIDIQILPDLFFMVMMLIHLEKRWKDTGIPAPIIALYGTILLCFGHFSSLNYFKPAGIPLLENANTVTQMLFLVLAMLILVWQSFRTASLTKKYLYLFLVQEVLILGFGIGNIFEPSHELFALQRYLLFVALMGMLVMIESRQGKTVNSNLLQGIFHERPRFTVVFLTLALMFVSYPAVFLESGKTFANSLLGLVLLSGLLWVWQLGYWSLQEPNREYRIIRPSLSIWSTVVFTILWSAVTLLETLSKRLFT